MQFSFVYGNHGRSPVQIGDLASYLQCGLTEAGHRVDFDQYVTPGACNIMMEYFDEAGAEALVDATRQGLDLIVIATEFVTGDTFNDFGQTGGADWYSHHEQWKYRFEAFRRVAGACRRVWCVSPEQLETYRAIVPPEKLHLIPVGYVEGFATVRHRPDAEKNIDFLFTGTPSPWREETLERLRQTGAEVVETTVFTPAFIRDDLVGRAKVCLNLKQNAQWQYPSTMRYFYHLMNGSFLLSERCAVASHLDPYITLPAHEDFFVSCMESLQRRDQAAVARDNLERFRREMPAAPRFARLLEASFAA